MIDLKHINQLYLYEGDLVNQYAGSYNRLAKMIHLIQTLEPKPKRVLDIGCGTGYFANEVKLLYPRAEVYGVDISKKAIQLGEKEFKNIHLDICDVENKLAFTDNYFDLVISGEHIEHLKDTDTYITEINRVLKTNGVLILTTPNLGFWFNRILLLFGKQPMFLEPSLRKTFPIFSFFNKTYPYDLRHPPAGHLRSFTKDILIKFLRYYGFEPEKVLGAKIFSMFFMKQLDYLFEKFPSLAFGLILKTRKARTVKL